MVLVFPFECIFNNFPSFLFCFSKAFFGSTQRKKSFNILSSICSLRPGEVDVSRVAFKQKKTPPKMKKCFGKLKCSPLLLLVRFSDTILSCFKNSRISVCLILNKSWAAPLEPDHEIDGVLSVDIYSHNVKWQGKYYGRVTEVEFSGKRIIIIIIRSNQNLPRQNSPIFKVSRKNNQLWSNYG